MQSVVLLFVLVCVSTAIATCGEDDEGRARLPGDTWREDCNRCRCLSSGIPGCTKKLCGTFPVIISPIESPICQDSQGRARQDGETWEEVTTVCSCGDGVVSCTTTSVITDRKENMGVRFPGNKDSKDDQDNKDDKDNKDNKDNKDSNDNVEEGCTDQGGVRRREEETWEEDCNTCRCLSGILSCTKVFCGDISLVTTGVFLLQSDSSRDVSKTPQCRQSGVQNCRAVTVNIEYLQQSLNTGDSINLIEGHDLSLKLSRVASGSPSSTLSYSFSLSDGGEGTVTMRPSTGAVFASIKPATYSAIYTVEPCGQGCNLLYQRDNQFFNNFQD